jgi:hypothetical protein
LKYKFPIYIIPLFFLLFLPWDYSFSEPVKTRVLFVGNSLTYVNDLPGMIFQMARSRNINMEYDMYAPGGYKLSQHASDPALIDKIRRGKWNFVVLQEQSQRPSFSQHQVEAEVYPYAGKLSRLIRESNPAAGIVFYMTMAWKNGDAESAKILPELGSYAGMQQNIIASYTKMAQQNQGLLAPVGIAWRNVRSGRPAVNLYGDNTHPNIAGSYLAACVFYGVLFKDSPKGLPCPSQIDVDTARYLQDMADQALKVR